MRKTKSMFDKGASDARSVTKGKTFAPRVFATTQDELDYRQGYDLQLSASVFYPAPH